MSVRRRGERWMVQVYDPVKGGKVYPGTFDTRAEAKAAEREAQDNLSRFRGRRRETVESFANRWMDDYPRTRESTTKGHRYWAQRIASDFGTRPLNDVDRVEARAYALKNRSVLHSIRAMFTDAVRDGLAESNPFVNLGLEGSRGRRDLVVPTEEELGDLVADHPLWWRRFREPEPGSGEGHKAGAVVTSRRGFLPTSRGAK